MGSALVVELAAAKPGGGVEQELECEVKKPPVPLGRMRRAMLLCKLSGNLEPGSKTQP